MIDTEGVCVCSHLIEDHVTGPCARCQDTPCMFFVLRFWREIGFVAARQDIPDPVGKYWREQKPPFGSPAWVFASLTEADRQEIHSDCFQDAQFDARGEIACLHDSFYWSTNARGVFGMRTQKGKCPEEYLCEVQAAHILMPESDRFWAGVFARWKEIPDDLVTAIAGHYDVEEWAVRFRPIAEFALPEKVREYLYRMMEEANAPVTQETGESL